jgi:hypothetical protein
VASTNDLPRLSQHPSNECGESATERTKQRHRAPTPWAVEAVLTAESTKMPAPVSSDRRRAPPSLAHAGGAAARRLVCRFRDHQQRGGQPHRRYARCSLRQVSSGRSQQQTKAALGFASPGRRSRGSHRSVAPARRSCGRRWRNDDPTAERLAARPSRYERVDLRVVSGHDVAAAGEDAVHHRQRGYADGALPVVPARCSEMTHAILFIENGDLLADFDTLDDARSALHEYVGDHPGVGARVGLLAFDDDGHPVASSGPSTSSPKRVPRRSEWNVCRSDLPRTLPRPAPHPPRAARIGGTSSSSGRRRGPSTPARGGGRGTAAVAGRRASPP